MKTKLPEYGKDIIYSRKTKCPKCGKLMAIGEKKLYCPECLLIDLLVKAKKKGLF